METKEQALINRFHEFESEVQKLQNKPEGLEQELSAKRGKLGRLKAGRASNLALDETRKAEILAKEIRKLESGIEILEAKVAAFGPGGRQSAEHLVSNAPGSDLYNQAISIIEEAAEIAPGLEKELQYFVNWGADVEKEKYLKIIEDFSEKLSVLWEISKAGLFCQKFLPEEFRKCQKPRLIPPNLASLVIDVERIGEVYNRMSKVFFAGLSCDVFKCSLKICGQQEV